MIELVYVLKLDVLCKGLCFVLYLCGDGLKDCKLKFDKVLKFDKLFKLNYCFECVLLDCDDCVLVGKLKFKFVDKKGDCLFSKFKLK